MIAPFIGAIWRIWDGAGYLSTTIRSIVLFALVMWIMAMSIDMWLVDAWPVWLWAVSIVAAMQRGYADWNLFDIRQITQYYYAALPLPILFYYGILTAPQCITYALFLVLAGLAHPVIVRTSLSHQTRWAEGIVGSCVVGGLMVL